MSTAPEQQHPDFASEQAFLRHAYATLEIIRSKPQPNADAGGNPKAMAAIRQLHEHLHGRLQERTVLFARLDEAGGRKLYVGPNLIWENPGVGDPLVISWASTKATPFYEASVADPMGLALRRRFRTDGQLLLGIADEWFGVGLEEEPTLDDFLLDELGRNRTSEMRQIAATIQAEQYAIIRRSPDSATIVQGGPGTGKTVVGLHRAALLLYRQREEGAAAGRVLVIGPNPLFMQYIRYVLPSLGESAADQQAISQLGPAPSNVPAEPWVARVKGDERMVEVLRRAVADRVRVPTEPTEFSVEGTTFKIAPEAIRDLAGDFDPAQDAYVDARTRFRRDLDNLVLGEYAKAARSQGRVPISLRLTDLPELDRLKDRVWPAIQAPDLLRQFLSSRRRIERLAVGILTDAEQRLIQMSPVDRLEDVQWTKSDVALADEVEFLLDHRPNRYWHVVVDETQDLTPMELRMVGRRARNGAITVLGDLAQATGLWKFENWDEIAEHLGLGGAYDMKELTLAYRVPREIMAVALPVLEFTAPSIQPPVSFRDGAKPKWHQSTRASLLADVVGLASSHATEDGSVAVIAPPTMLPALRAELERQGVDFADGERDELAATLEVLDPAMAKGLEFDHVYLVEPSRLMREGHEDRRLQELYVALTRATRTLTILYSETLRAPLAASRPATEGESPISSIAEALEVAGARGLNPEHARVRALIVKARGGSEAEAAAAALDPSSIDAGVVAAFMRVMRSGTDASDGQG